MNNTLYNIFAVIGMLSCTVIFIVILFVIFGWLKDVLSYYFGSNNYEPMEVPPLIVERKPMPLYSLGSSIDAEFHGGRYK